ncbi:MAG: hypothetical protein ACUVUC_04080 [Thermoguttaceae bacterium]
MCRFAAWLIACTVPAAACADGLASPQPHSPWYEGFEGPEASWRLVGGNARYRVEQHQRVRGEAHTGQGAEYIRLLGSGGSEVYFSHQVGRPWVIDELLPTVWVKADRPGIQLAAQVVLPRTRDPATQAPVTAVVKGSTYTTVGRWQQLRLEDIPRLLRRQLPLLRARWGAAVDPREAYLERVLLNVYGGPGLTNLWIDDLDIAGYVGPPAGQETQPVPLPDLWRTSEPAASATMPGGEQQVLAPSRIRLSGSVVTVDGRPFFARIIQYQGEPLSLLKQLGFNAVWAPAAPPIQLLQEAQDLGLWVICPPPALPGPLPDGAQAPPAPFGPQFDSVLAWDLGSSLGSQQLPQVRRLAELLRAADQSQPPRPLVCRPDRALWAYSRCVPILLVGRPVFGSSLELDQYGDWLRQRRRLALPGTVMWTAVQTQPAGGLRLQWAAFQKPDGPLALPAEQIRLAVHTALGAGARGILFESYSRLDAPDPDTQARALSLELVNLQLQLIEPWGAAGVPVDLVPGSQQGTAGAVLQAERARLLLPIWSTAGSQYVPGQLAARGVSLLVPGVPEASEAYQILPGGLPPVVHKRVALGMRLSLDEFGLDAAVLMTQDPRAITEITRRAGQISRRAASLYQQLAAARLQAVAEVSDRLSAHSGPLPQADQWIALARQHLQQSQLLWNLGDSSRAYIQAERAMRPLRLLERAHWDRAVAWLPSPVASPLAVCYQTLPEHLELMRKIAGLAAGNNLLPGGEFEQPEGISANGWRHFQHQLPGVQSAAELSPAAARSGQFGLRLSAQPSDPADSPAQLESPPVWVTTPPVHVEPGQLMRIDGWVHLPRPITASVDGLMIVDSLAGEVLAERIHQTGRWRPFTLYRAAAQSGPMTVSFILTGLGEAWVDDVTVQALQPASAAQAGPG